MKGHNYGKCRKCGRVHASPRGMLGMSHTAETKQRMSESHMGHIAWNKDKKCPSISVGVKKTFESGRVPWNKDLTKETDERIKGHPSWNKGLTKETDERVRRTGEAVSKSLKGRKKPEGFGEKIRVAQLASNSFAGKHHSKQWRREHSKRMSGEGNSNFRDWASCDPYGRGWNENLKQQVRVRDDFVCQFCGANTKSTHHIDYDKNHNEESNLILLCNSCHMGANYNREDWISFFANKLYLRGVK